MNPIEQLDQPKKTYNSMFDSINFEKNTRQLQEFQGSIEQLLEEIEKALTEENELMVVARMPQILRPIFSIKDHDFEETRVYAAYGNAIRAIIYAYSGEFKKAKEYLKICVESIKEVANISETQVQEKGDLASWIACSPKYSERTIKSISEWSNNQDVVFIPLANGGTRSGFDVFLRYQSQHGSKASKIFPTRYSRYKNNDKQPQLSEIDKAYLERAVGSGMPLVIFEEDSNTGKTRDSAIEYFKKEFPNAKIMAITNYDSLTDW